MRPSGGPPPEESQALGSVSGLDLKRSTASLAPSHSYACLDVISFDHFVLPRLKLFSGLDGEGGDEQESAQESLTSSTISPMTRLAQLIPRDIPTRYASNTLEVIDTPGKNLASWKSTPTTEDTNKGEIANSDSPDVQLISTLKTAKQDQQRMREASLIESCGYPDNTRSMLYNWHLLRMDKIRILDPLWQGFRGASHDYELLKLLAQTHEHQRWWLIVVDDFACPQCVEILKRHKSHLRFPLQKALKGLQSMCSKHVHCDGGRCNIICTHTSEDCNKVTQFFSKLGKENSSRMRNILLETRDDQLPDADVLVSVAHNVGHYFPDVQNLEINFHFGDKHLDEDAWTRILCACRRLEHYLPKGQHLRIRGIEKHTELQNDWTRKGRKWHE